MFVQVALKHPVSQQAGKQAGEAVRQAIGEVLPGELDDCFVYMAFEDDGESVIPTLGGPGGHCVAIIIHAGEKYPGSAKRRLFGRILDRLETDLHIQRTGVLIGIVDMPAANWSTGYSRWHWPEMLSYQLP